jgi:hypothetical protein
MASDHIATKPDVVRLVNISTVEDIIRLYHTTRLVNVLTMVINLTRIIYITTSFFDSKAIDNGFTISDDRIREVAVFALINRECVIRVFCA